MTDSGKRYIGLDVHKHYLIALGVDEDLKIVLPARRVELFRLETWMKKTLTRQNEVVLEMTTNTWQLYDELCEYAGSVLRSWRGCWPKDCWWGSGCRPRKCGKCVVWWHKEER